MRKILMASIATAAATLAMTGGAKAQPVKPVAPGTVVVHVNGYLQFEIAGYGSTDNRTIAGKANPITTDGDARLYAGFDAETLNGIAYGAQIETRTTTSDAGVGIGKSTGSGGGSGSGSLYIKRAYGYVGSKTGGYVRLGQGDGPFSLMQSGVVEAFGDGAQFNTDGGEYSLLPSDAASANFIYADASGLYATDKVVYLTPAIAGFSAGIGYEPNSNGLKEGYATNAGASSTSADLSSSTYNGDIGKRRKNTIDAALQYAIKADGVAYKVSGGILYGSPINYIGLTPASPSALHYGYDNLEVYQVGAQATFAGLTIGANVKGGQVLDGYSFKVKGTRDAFTYIVGASYVIGPYVIGASFFDGQTAGSYVPGKAESKTLSEYGVSTGANYVISPNLSLFVQYEYGHRHQPGNSALDVSGGGTLPTSTATAAATPTASAADTAKGTAQVQAIAAGATFKF